MTFPIALVIIGILAWDAWRRHTNRLGTSRLWATRGDLADVKQRMTRERAETLEALATSHAEVAQLRKELTATVERSKVPERAVPIGLPGKARV